MMLCGYMLVPVWGSEGEIQSPGRVPGQAQMFQKGQLNTFPAQGTTESSLSNTDVQTSPALPDEIRAHTDGD